MSEGAEGTAMVNESEAVALKWFEEVWGNHKEEWIDELLHPDSVVESDGRQIAGAEAFKELQYRPFWKAFPDLKVKVERIDSHGEEVVVYWSAVGAHTGDGLPDSPPTGKRVEAWGISWIVVRGGKFLRGRQVSNLPLALARLRPEATPVA